MTDELGRLKELAAADPDINLMCNIVLAKNDCTSLAMLMDKYSDVFDELLVLAEDMASADPEPGQEDLFFKGAHP